MPNSLQRTKKSAAGSHKTLQHVYIFGVELMCKSNQIIPESLIACLVEYHACKILIKQIKMSTKGNHPSKSSAKTFQES